VIPGIIQYEQAARQALLKERRVALEDKVHRALAVLRSCRLISSEESMYLFSHLRLGVNLRLIADVDLRTISELSVLVQPAHLQRHFRRPMGPPERGQARADLIRQRLGT
jgi:protein arginine kinase